MRSIFVLCLLLLAFPFPLYGQTDVWRATSLTKSQAQILAEKSQSPKSFLTLPNLKVIDAEIATELAKANGELALPQITKLSLETAQALANHQGSLVLIGVTDVSPEIAQALAQQKGQLILGLNNATSVALHNLSQHPGSLVLPNLISISDEQAQALSNHKGILSLPQIVSLSETQAEHLAKIPANLELTELKELTPEAEEKLAKHTRFLRVTKLDKITSAAFAAKLAATSNKIELYRVATISDECLHNLIQFKGTLTLGLDTLNANQATILAQHVGKLNLCRISKLSPEVTDCLVLHRGGLMLDSLEQLTDIRLARALTANKPAYIKLDKRKRIEPKIAQTLTSAKCSLMLSGLDEITDETATILGQHEGILSLLGLSSLSLESAKVLAKHQKMLRLGNRQRFTEDVLAILDSNPFIRFLEVRTDPNKD